MRDVFNGAMPAAASPCDEKDVFLEDVFASLMKSLADTGVKGFYLCGGTGEGYKMKLAERKRAAEIAVKVASKRKQKVIVHVGTNNTRDAMDLASHAAEAGADAVSSIPLVNVSPKQLAEYYSDIAKASQLPVIIYHVPIMTKTNPTLDEILQLLDIDGVIGLKYTDWNLFLMKRLRMARPETVIFNGFDELLLPALEYGADGGIGTNYNLFPKLFMGIYDAFKAGDLNKALVLQNKYLDYADVLWETGIVGLFEHLMAQRGFGPRCWRRPRNPLDSAVLRKVESRLNKAIAAIEEATK